MTMLLDSLSEDEIFSTHKDAVARWMKQFIHEDMYFEEGAKTVASVLGVKVSDVFSVATRIIQEGVLSAEEEQN